MMKYENIFTPGAPIKSRHYLFGRDQELSDLRRICKRPGFHPIVIGNRGVGKTSLAIQAFTHISPQPIRIGCNPQMTFQRLACEILKGVGYDIGTVDSTQETSKQLEGKGTLLGIGGSISSTQKDTIKRRELGSENIDPWLVFSKLKEIKSKYIIIIDEYDAIPRNHDLHTSVAHLIKHLSDHSDRCDTRIVVVGVAQSAQDLLGRHESIERSAREIYLRPLRKEDVFSFLSEAEHRLRIKFEPKVKDEIVNGSMGYPYYVHLVGLECMDAMRTRDKKSRTITETDFNHALKNAVQQAFRSVLRKYRNACQDLTSNEYALIRELAEQRKDQLTRKTLQSIFERKGIMKISDFDHAWVRLQQEKRIVYVSRNTDIIRFADPLMAPFLRSAGYFLLPKNPEDHSSQLHLFED